MDDPVIVEINKRESKGKKGSSLSFGTNFCFQRITSLLTSCFYPERLLLSDRKLDESVRLCDTREYLDTITIASDLLEDGEQFFKLMKIVTRGGFLRIPCKGSRSLIIVAHILKYVGTEHKKDGSGMSLSGSTTWDTTV